MSDEIKWRAVLSSEANEVDTAARAVRIVAAMLKEHLVRHRSVRDMVRLLGESGPLTGELGVSVVALETRVDDLMRAIDLVAALPGSKEFAEDARRLITIEGSEMRPVCSGI